MMLALVLAAAQAASPSPSPSAGGFDTSSWTRAAEAFRVIGPVHYVGTEDLGVFLVTSPKGHVLVDGTLGESAPLIERSIRALGFDPKHIKAIVTTQAHCDHVGSMAYFKRTTGAQVAVMDGDLELLRSGGRTDYLYGEKAVSPVPQAWFEPVAADRVLKDGDTVVVGDLTLTARKTPGHTPGSTTWLLRIVEDGRPLTVAFAASTGFNPGTRFVGVPSYPGIVDDFTRAFQVLESLSPDVPLGSHAGFFGLWSKRARQKEGAGPNPFVDPEAFRAHVAERRKSFEARLAEERAGAVSPTKVTPLFNGRDLTGWTADVPARDADAAAPASFVVRDGLLVSLGTPPGHLLTDASYRDYRLEVEYRFPGKGGNCGVLVHASKPRALYRMFPQSIEVQMMSGEAGDFWCIQEDIEVPAMETRRPRQDKQKWGGAEGDARRILNLTDGSEKPLGEWNTMVVEARGRSLTVWVNGDLVNDGRNATADRGRIALQAEGTEVEFRKVTIGPLGREAEAPIP
jgi:glyoxylase-like metal-dependent hydrolase (beta-lactamase superfamily II)